MKTLNILLLGLGLLAGVTSCEMKDEILGDKDDLSGDTGTLSLGLETNNETNTIVTKADSGDETINAFPVTIYDSTGEVYESYNSYSDVPEMLRMPVGEYRVEAHSSGNFETRMSTPYFAGEETLSITKDVESEATILCKMQNLPIVIQPDESFLVQFTTWTIQLDDGKGSTLTFTNTDTAPYSAYWKIGENVTSIAVHVTATTTTGDQVSQNYTCTKSGANEDYIGDTENFVGGDKLVINLSPEDADVTVGVTIGITVDITFSDSTETVEIPVDVDNGGDSGTTDPSEPGTGDDNPIEGLSIQLPADITYSLSAGNAPSSADAVITSAAGLKNLVVKIEAGNSGFKTALEDMAEKGLDFVGGSDLVGNDAFQAVMSELPGGDQIVTPQAGDKSYSFPIAVFFTMLNIYQTTDQNSPHKFIITVTDNNNQTTSGTLSVTINE